MSSSTQSKPDQSDVSVAGRRARVGDVIEFRAETGALIMAEIDRIGPSEMLAKHQLTVFEIHGDDTGDDHFILRSQVVRLWREVTR